MCICAGFKIYHSPFNKFYFILQEKEKEKKEKTNIDDSAFESLEKDFQEVKLCKIQLYNGDFFMK